MFDQPPTLTDLDHLAEQRRRPGDPAVQLAASEGPYRLAFSDGSARTVGRRELEWMLLSGGQRITCVIGPDGYDFTQAAALWLALFEITTGRHVPDEGVIDAWSSAPPHLLFRQLPAGHLEHLAREEQERRWVAHIRDRDDPQLRPESVQHA